MALSSILKRLLEPGRAWPSGYRRQRLKPFRTMHTRAMIQPRKSATDGKRRLWLSVGWLLDRGFMGSLAG
jgi:hypothetical protein